MTSIKERQSNIELLKIIAIFIIISFHVACTLVDFYDNKDISSIQKITIWIFRNIGIIGNTIFIICSSWFLFDKENYFIHFKIKKAIRILLDSMTISIIIFCIYILLTKDSIGYKDILSNIFPDIFRNVWFVPCYVIYYCLHPLMNASISILDRKMHFTLCIVSFFLYGILGLFTLQPFYSLLIEFIIIFYVVSYIKLYKNEFNDNLKKNLVLFIIFCFIYVFYLVFLVDIFDMKYHINPITTPMCIFLFNIFNGLKIKSNIINYISSCSLHIYCFSGNQIVVRKLMALINNYLFNVFNNLIYVLIAHTLLLAIVSLLLSILYRKIFNKSIDRISYEIVCFGNRILDLIFSK